MKTLNFSGSFVACDLKVGRYRQHVELMKCCEYKRSRSFLDLGQRSFSNLMLKLNFLSNHMTNQSQILHVVSLGWRNNLSLYNWSRSHDQDGHHGFK